MSSTSSAASKAGPLTVTVNMAGDQPEVDLCKGPVLTHGIMILQHDYCGGTQFYSLKVGSPVVLAGSAIVPGTYHVVSIADAKIGATNFVHPTQYALQTCISTTTVRLWYIERG